MVSKTQSKKKSPAKPEKKGDLEMAVSAEHGEDTAGTETPVAATGGKSKTESGSAKGSYKFLKPLPNGFHTKLFHDQAAKATGERKTKLMVMATLYSGFDYAEAANQNNVGLGDVYLWLSEFRRGGLAAL